MLSSATSTTKSLMNNNTNNDNVKKNSDILDNLSSSSTISSTMASTTTTSKLQRILLTGSKSVLNNDNNSNFLAPTLLSPPAPLSSSTTLSQSFDDISRIKSPPSSTTISVPAFLSTLLQQPIGFNGNFGYNNLFDHNKLSTSSTTLLTTTTSTAKTSTTRTPTRRQNNKSKNRYNKNDNLNKQIKSKSPRTIGSRSPLLSSTTVDEYSNVLSSSTNGQIINYYNQNNLYYNGYLIGANQNNNNDLNNFNHRSQQQLSSLLFDPNRQQSYCSEKKVPPIELSSTTSSILMQAHQNDTHDSLASTMPLLSSYLRSKNSQQTLKSNSNNRTNDNNLRQNYDNSNLINHMNEQITTTTPTTPMKKNNNPIKHFNCTNNFDKNDSVRFGRVPKREKAKILAAMQKVNAHSLEKALSVLLEDEQNLMQSIIKAHEETCDYTKEKVAPLLETARSRPIYAQCPQMTCPLNPLPPQIDTTSSTTSTNGTNRLMEDFSERFSPAIHGVVEFAKRIPGFNMLAQEDQVTLLKAGVFEVLLVRLACMFDSQTNSMVCLNGLSLRRDSLHSASNARFLLDSMFEFAERLNSLRLTDQEIGLFCAVVVIAPDRPGLRNVDLVQKINKRLEEVLQKSIATNHHQNFSSHNSSQSDSAAAAAANTLFIELTKKIPDLRTLNALHSDKLLGKSFGGLEQSTTTKHHSTMTCPRIDTCITATSTTKTVTTTNTTVPQNHHNNQIVQPDSQSNESPDRWSSTSSTSSTMMGHYSPASVDGEHNHLINSNHLNHHDLWMESVKDSVGTTNGSSQQQQCFGSPSSISSGVSSDDNTTSSTGRKGSISSSTSSSSSSSLAPKLANFNYIRTSPATPSSQTATSPSPMVVAEEDSANYQNHIHRSTPRVDSPTDSGIESGKETHHSNGSAPTPTPSVCSSPRSAIEDTNHTITKDNIHHCTSSDSETGSEKHETIDDMPVLKRALQAPPLVNTNKLMDEAYRHHKKFRAAARNCNGSRVEEPHSPSTTSTMNHRGAMVTSTPTGVITSHSSSASTSSQLASTHSTLLKTLEQPSRYMNEQQLKRTDLIHNIIMNTEAVQTPATTPGTPITCPIYKDSSVAATAPVQQYNHHQQQHNQYPPETHIFDIQPQQQVTMVYAPQNPGYPYSHHINSNPGTGCPFNHSEQSRIVSNSSPTLQYHQQTIYRTSPSPSFIVDQQNSSQKLLVINNVPAAAHSPTSVHSRPSSSLSNHSASSNHGGHQYSHLQRCLTATTAPTMATQGPILLQTAAQQISPENEPDCQPLNLSKKASSSSTPSPTSKNVSPSLSSHTSSGIHSTPTTINSSSIIKMEVDPQNV